MWVCDCCPATTGEILLMNEWWEKSEGVRVDYSLFHPDSLYMAHVGDEPVLGVALITTDACYNQLEVFIGNPDAAIDTRRAATKDFLAQLEEISKSRGKRKLVCFAPNERLKEYYEKLGFRKTLSVEGMIKEL